MKILVINAGSSSIKYQLINMNNEEVMAKGLCERIGMDGSKLTHKPQNKETFSIEAPMEDHGAGIKMIIDALVDKKHGVIKDMSEISAVGHRVLHAGEYFSDPAIINDEVMHAIRECIDLGPLHNPANITGIEACKKAMPNVPMVAVFDTGFHQTMPKYAYLYAIPYKYYEKYKVRKYGFHGTSHEYVSQRAAKVLKKPIEELKLITCHLGNGSSIAAVKAGKCIDTSMGFTPLAGLVMGTRSGDIDPAVIPFLMKKENLSYSDIDNMLNKKSGVLGISGLSSDFRDLVAASNAGNERAKLALDMFTYRCKKFIGEYAAAMGGVDAVIFTGGIGENSIGVRAEILEGLEFLGIKIDLDKNNVKGKETDISANDALVKTLVIPTNEELKIALDTKRLVYNE